MLLVVKIALGIAAVYLTVVVVMVLAQDRLLFPRWAVANGPALPATAERLTLGLASRDELVGVHLPAENRSQLGAALLLGFGGNAWNADVLAIYLQSMFPDRAVAAFHYRGYGPSTGELSAGAILEDAVTIHDHIVASLAPDRIVAVGLSLGAGPATHLATEPVAGLILVTPFDSLTALAREHYPWLPVGLLLRHRMEVADSLARVATPVALISATADTVVPPPRTEPVRWSVRNLVLDHVVPEAGHNNLYDRAEFKGALREALALIEDSR
jgi:pimeloyl-ACP methyl ester carboxylesterase